MLFTLRQLEYVVALAKHRSFREAAEACCVSQPSLSVQIAQLETALGTRLFERSPKRVVITSAGEEFVRRAARALADLEQLEGMARSRRKPLAGELRLGAIPTMAPFLVPRLVELVKSQFPECRLLLTEDTTARLLRRLDSGELDVLLIAMESELGICEATPLFRDPFLAALPAAHPLAEKATITFEELLGDGLLLLEDGHCLTAQVRSACGASSSQIGDFRAGSLVTLLQMVALGHGLTLLPEMARDALARDPAQVAIRPLAEPAYRTVGLAWRRGHSRAAELRLLAEAAARGLGTQKKADGKRAGPRPR